MKILGCFLKRSKSIRTLSLLFGFLCLAFSASFGQVPDIVVKNKVFIRADQGPAGMNKDLGAINVDVPGHYRIFAHTFYNSGDEQLNESYYIDISNNSGGEILPQDSNAGVYKVVPDEPGTPHTSSKDSGTFKLFEGINSINIYHYAKIAHIYPQFINNIIEGPESVKILGFKIKYVNR